MAHPQPGKHIAQDELFSPEVRALIYNNHLDAIIVSDQDGELLMYNRVAARLFGNQRSIQALLWPERSGQRMWRVTDSNGVEIAPKVWPFLRARHGVLFSDEVYWMEQRDLSHKFPISINTTIYREGKTNRRITVIAMRDLTAQKTAEQEASRHLFDLMKLVEVSRDVVASRDRGEILRSGVKAAAVITSAHLVAAQYSFTGEGFLYSAWDSAETKEDFMVSHFRPMLRVYAGLLFDPILHLRETDLTAHAAWWGTEGGPIPLKELLAARLEDEDGKADGWIVVGRRKGPVFSASDEFIIGQIASIISLSLRQAGSQESLQEQKDRLEKLTQDLKALNQTLEAQVAERTRLAERRSRQLLALNVELVEAEERERGRLADLLHEDLQQILASALLLLQKLQSDVSDRGEGGGLIRRIVEILQESLSKARYLSYELSPPILHHAGLLPAVQWLSRRMKDQYGLETVVDASQWKGLEEKTVRSLLYRSIQELLFNVVKHADTRSVTVRLAHEGGLAEATVCDKGRGFDAATLRASGGAAEGFGLMAIQERIQAMGGTFALESAPGAGTCVTLAVPVLPAVEAAQVPALPAGEAAQAGNGSIFRVLLVDDHKVMRQGLMAILQGQRDVLVVGEASNGREAVELARTLKPNVIVMDVVMPEMDGVEATRLIKTENPDIRVVGLSMMDDMADKMRGAGADCLISKAASTGTLLRAIYGLSEAPPS